MQINPLYFLRGAQLLLAFFVLGLDAYVASWFDTTALVVETPASFAFLLFTAVFTILIVLPYTTFAPRYFPKIASKYPMLIAETTTALFWFGGFVATADVLRKLTVCRGLVCHSARAATVLGSFEFALFAATSWFAIKHVRDGPRSDVEKGHGRSDSFGMKGLRERKWFGLGRERGVERL